MNGIFLCTLLSELFPPNIFGNYFVNSYYLLCSICYELHVAILCLN